MPIKMLKKNAISAIAETCKILLKYDSTHFANINVSKPVWWLEIPVEKFTSGRYATINFLLFDPVVNQLHHLSVQTVYIQCNIDNFSVRKDRAKPAINFELSSQKHNLFQDVRPGGGKMAFDQFIVSTITTTP